jgi:hypothetical protein
MITSWTRKPIMIAEIFKDIGLVFFGTMVVGAAIADHTKVAAVIFGIILSLSSWSMAILLTNK